MRFVFLLSGATGFLLAVLAGLRADRQPDLILRDAAIVCLGTALLGRWFWTAVDRAAGEAAALRRAAAAALAETENPSSPAPSPGRAGRSLPTAPQLARKN